MNIHTIETNIEKLRDPFVLAEDGTYYMYGSEWICYKNTGSLTDGKWTKSEKQLTVTPKTFVKDNWAPEVHKYKGSYYMFTTYFSSVTKRHGCTIMKSDSPDGPFIEITDGTITPAEWDCIDGTFYVDSEGQPWMVFVHEWVSTDDNIGRMAIAKLSADLTHFISEPKDIFRADDPSWTNAAVTDGCFMYTTKDNKLLMLWSNFDKNGGYCSAVSHSENGKLDGKWIHDDRPLYSKDISGKYDGGHGMIFTDFDGQMYLSLHSPNAPVNDRMEKPILIPVKEENGTIVLL